MRERMRERKREREKERKRKRERERERDPCSCSTVRTNSLSTNAFKHTYYVTSYMLCHIIIHTMPHHHTINECLQTYKHITPIHPHTTRVRTHAHTYRKAERDRHRHTDRYTHLEFDLDKQLARAAVKGGVDQ